MVSGPKAARPGNPQAGHSVGQRVVVVPYGQKMVIVGVIPAVSPDWISATYQNSWSSFDVGNYGAAQYRAVEDYVEIRGVVKHASNSTAAIFTLPTGYRPVKAQLATVPAGTTGLTATVIVQSDGVVRVSGYGAGATSGFVVLSNIRAARGA